MGLHHYLLGFCIRLSTNFRQASGDEFSFVEGVVEQSNFPGFTPNLLLFFRILLYIDDFNCFGTIQDGRSIEQSEGRDGLFRRHRRCRCEECCGGQG